MEETRAIEAAQTGDLPILIFEQGLATEAAEALEFVVENCMVGCMGSW